jgi:hypothetical protein
VADSYPGRFGGRGDPDRLSYLGFRSVIWRNLGDDLHGRSALDLRCGPGWLAGEMHVLARVVSNDRDESRSLRPSTHSPSAAEPTT